MSSVISRPGWLRWLLIALLVLQLALLVEAVLEPSGTRSNLALNALAGVALVCGLLAAPTRKGLAWTLGGIASLCLVASLVRTAT